MPSRNRLIPCHYSSSIAKILLRHGADPNAGDRFTNSKTMPEKLIDFSELFQGMTQASQQVCDLQMGGPTALFDIRSA